MINSVMNSLIGSLLDSVFGARVIAGLAALAAAAVIALGTALQQRATQAAPGGRGLHLPLLFALVRDRRWLAGVVATITGFGLYLVALANGALSLAQPIMITGLIFGPAFAAWLAGRRVDRLLLVGGAVCGTSLALFLAVAQPSGGAPSLTSGRDAIIVGAVLGGALLITSVIAARGKGLTRALALAVVTAILFGVNAAFAKLVADQLTAGWLEPFRHPACYLMLLTSPVGFVLSQRAMQLGRLLAPVSAVISTVDPLTAVLIGILALGERMDTSPPALAAELVAAVVLVAGIALVSRRAARLIDLDRAAEVRGMAAPTWG